jgi:hypothetical protein
MSQPFTCVTPDETAQSHAVFAAALKSHQQTQVVKIDYTGFADA